MSGRCTVFVSDGTWRVACVGAEGARVRDLAQGPDADLRARAVSVAEAVSELGGSGPVVLALPSSWCLSASVLTDGLGRSGRRQAMAYLLEEHLPVSAEDTVADYAERGGEALGVCVELNRLAPIIDALDEAGVPVRHVCPAALLTTGHWLDQYPGADAAYLTQSPSPTGTGQRLSADLIELDHKTPRRWWWLTDTESVNERFDALQANANGTPHTLLTAGATDATIERPGIAIATAQTPDTDQAAALQAARILDGDATAWIDLRRDALAVPGRSRVYQKQGVALSAALGLLLLCVIVATYWRGLGYRAEASRFDNQQAELWKELMPGQRTPATVRTRLLSEQRRLEGQSGLAPAAAAGDSGQALRPTSALTHLHRVLTALPRDQRYQITSMVIEPSKLQFDGLAANSVIPSNLAKALRAGDAYDADDPNTRAQGSNVFSFTLFARPKADSPREDRP